MSCVQWYWPFIAGVATAQLTESGAVSACLKYVLPPFVYQSAYLTLSVTRLMCFGVTNSCKMYFRPKVQPTNPPRTFDFVEEVEDSEDDETVEEKQE